MRRILAVIAIAAVCGFVTSVEPSVSEAAIVYPWCARARISEVGAPSCGFSSYEQCMAAQASFGGACSENPFYQGPAGGDQQRRKPLAR